MQQILKRYRVVLIPLVAALVVLLGAWFFLAPHAATDIGGDLSAKNLTALIERDGPKKAYAQFLAENGAEAAWGKQHVTAHVMGEVLYRKYGTDGVVYCDSSFGFGCYHGFFGVALEEGGEAAIPKLDAACVSTYGPWGTGCTHGIGHGVLEFAGADHLNDALALCKQTTQLSPYLGCTSGAFMEYNTPLVSRSDGSTPAPRQLDTDKPYAPCTSVPEENRASCYFELGGWYRVIMSDYAKIGELCSGLAGDNRKNCYLGVGALIPPTEKYDPERALSLCSTYSGNDQLSCRAGAYWAFYADPTRREHAAFMCGYTEGNLRASCERLADLTGGLIGK